MRIPARFIPRSAVPAGGSQARLDRLQQLADLHERGVLSDDEFAAEISNQTVHGVMHVAWVGRDSDDDHEAQMAVYVKPRGRFGQAYMAFIKPFRYLIVYPALQRQLARTWSRRRAVP